MLSLLTVLTSSVPKRYPGMLYGNENEYKILIDMYCDPLCSDCAYSWPTIKKVLQYHPKDLLLRFHTVPLDIHTWSYHSVKAVQALRLMDEGKAKQMLDKLYDGDQINFLNTEMFNTSENQAIQKFCSYVATNFDVNQNDYYNQYVSMQTRSAAGQESVLSITHQVMGTPTFEINGVKSDFNEETTFTEWVEYLDSLL